MTDLIVGAILVVLVGAAIAYIRKEKKRGVKCVGCPEGINCASYNNPGGCGCSIDAEAVEAELRKAVSESHTEE